MTENEEKRFGYDSISAHPFFAGLSIDLAEAYF